MSGSSRDSSPLRVDVIGTNRRMLEGLQSAFAGRGQARYLIVNATVAEALIVDLTDIQSEALWKDYRREFPGRPTIVLSTEPIDIPVDCILQLKPLDLEQLFKNLESFRGRSEEKGDFRVTTSAARRVPEATAQSLQQDPIAPSLAPKRGPSYQNRLDDVSTLELAESSPEAEDTRPREGKHVQAKDAEATTIIEGDGPVDGFSNIDLMGDRPDQDLIELESDSSLFLGTGHTLLSGFQASLKAAVTSGASTAMKFDNHTLIITPGEELVFHRTGTQPLYQLCKQTLGGERVQLSTTARPSRNDAAWQVESVTAILWKMALWTYQGRLPPQTDVQSRMYLAYWPNFTRLLPLPNALRIAALWTEQPMPICFTADALRIPQRNVFAFYSAAYTIGLSGQARRGADHLFQPGALSG